MKVYSLFFVIFLILINSCVTTKGVKKYPEQIGDTEFDYKIDNPNFKFCDSLNVLHQRGRVTYKRGYRDFEKDLISSYHFDESYKDFTG